MMEKEKVKFEVKTYVDNDNMISKGIFIDGKLFDWGIDEDSYKEVAKMGPKYLRVIQADIAKHFIESMSEFMNRDVTQAEVDKATKDGWIYK
jgi:hypothetical protein